LKTPEKNPNPPWRNPRWQGRIEIPQI